MEAPSLQVKGLKLAGASLLTPRSRPYAWMQVPYLWMQVVKGVRKVH